MLLVCRATQAAYALQLALGALSGIVEGCVGAAVPDLDIGAVLACAQQSDSVLVRGAALALLGRLASALPQAELERIVQVGRACEFPPCFRKCSGACKTAEAVLLLPCGAGPCLVQLHCKIVAVFPACKRLAASPLGCDEKSLGAGGECA